MLPGAVIDRYIPKLIVCTRRAGLDRTIGLDNIFEGLDEALARARELVAVPR